MLEVTDACLDVWPAGRVGMHLAPRGDAHDMGDSDPAATFGLGRIERGFLGEAAGEVGVGDLAFAELAGDVGEFFYASGPRGYTDNCGEILSEAS